MAIGNFLMDSIDASFNNPGAFLRVSPMKARNHTTTKKPNSIMKNVDNGRKVNIKDPTSYREIDPETDEIFIADKTKGKDIFSIPSTAIADVKYDPDRNVAAVRYTNSDKYYDFDVNPEELNSLLTAPSKGRWVQYIWKQYNRLNNWDKIDNSDI